MDFSTNALPIVVQYARRIQKREDSAIPLPSIGKRYPVSDIAAEANSPRPGYLADTIPVGIPISPDWTMTLFGPSTSRQPHICRRGALLGIDHTYSSDRLVVKLFWQGTPDVIPGDANAGTYTAFVHVLDAQGQRIAGYDTQLAPAAPARQPEDLFISEHPIQLPQGPPPGVY